MYLFSRRRRANPAQARAAIERAVEIAGRATQITGLEIRPWSAVLSPELGTIVWATFVEHLDEIETATDKLTAETSFGDLVEQSASMFLGPAEDGLLQLVHGQPGTDRPNYVSAVRSVGVNGSLAAAMAAGVEIAEAASRITGRPTSFATSLTGAYGSVGWFTGFPDLATMEQGNAALLADPDWIALIDRVGTLFSPDTSTTVYRALA